MSDDLMPQHKRMAMGEIDVATDVKSPWGFVKGPKGSKELSDKQRSAKVTRERPNDNDGDRDY